MVLQRCKGKEAVDGVSTAVYRGTSIDPQQPGELGIRSRVPQDTYSHVHGVSYCYTTTPVFHVSFCTNNFDTLDRLYRYLVTLPIHGCMHVVIRPFSHTRCSAFVSDILIALTTPCCCFLFCWLNKQKTSSHSVVFLAFSSDTSAAIYYSIFVKYTLLSIEKYICIKHKRSYFKIYKY